jgi:SAM-dependent methyltransferase
MLEVARSRGVYRRLDVADVAITGWPAGAYDLCIRSLADEHLADLGPLYREAARLTRGGGHFVLVGYHPHFLMAGVPTHYDRGQSITIRSYVHLLSDHVKAAHAAEWTLLEMDEGLVDEAWPSKKPGWGPTKGCRSASWWCGDAREGRRKVAITVVDLSPARLRNRFARRSIYAKSMAASAWHASCHAAGGPMAARPAVGCSA